MALNLIPGAPIVTFLTTHYISYSQARKLLLRELTYRLKVLGIFYTTMGSAMSGVGTNRHVNDERTVHCPVEGCDETPLARGVHLHVRQSVGDGHGPRGSVPKDIDFSNLTTAGERSVEMDYPESREEEETVRLCPYCRRPFKGKRGVLIHLGQMTERDTHPDDPTDVDPSDFPVAEVDREGFIHEVTESGIPLPPSERRHNGQTFTERVEEYIEELEAEGRTEEVERVREMLLPDA